MVVAEAHQICIILLIFSIRFCTLEKVSPSFIFLSLCCLIFVPSMLNGETICTFMLQPFLF